MTAKGQIWVTLGAAATWFDQQQPSSSQPNAQLRIAERVRPMLIRRFTIKPSLLKDSSGAFSLSRLKVSQRRRRANRAAALGLPSIKLIKRNSAPYRRRPSIRLTRYGRSVGLMLRESQPHVIRPMRQLSLAGCPLSNQPHKNIPVIHQLGGTEATLPAV